MSVSSVTITELTGKRRALELLGGALPVRGAKWTTGVVVPTSVNPGNVESTQQVLGPREMPSDWTFRWSTPVLATVPSRFVDGGSEVLIDNAESLRVIIDDMLFTCPLLQVTWVATPREGYSARQVRQGRSSEYSFAYDTADDIIGSIRFEWLGRGESQPRVSDIQGNGLIASLRQAQLAANEAAIAAFARDLHRAKQTTDPLPTQFTLDDLEALVNAPRELMDQFARFANGVSDRLKQLGGIVIAVKETPAALFSRALDVANNAVSVANTFADEIGREGPETLGAQSNAAMLAQNTGVVGAAQLAAWSMSDSAELLAEQARTRRSGSVSSAGSSRRQDRMRADDVLRVYLPREGDTMYTISQRHYGTADLASEISRANGLPGYTVVPPAKTPIIIPSRRSLEEQTRDRI